MIDSPQKTLSLIRGLKGIATEARDCSRNKDYNSGEIFNRIINQLSETEEEIKDSIKGWEKIMNKG
tara:strand:- start:142 stop:339 length:198 start_codon:yes stop_codon:yes gene_type:complete